MLAPQASRADTVMVAATVPAVATRLSVVLLPVHPAPDMVHKYEVAPAIGLTLYTAAVPGHGVVGMVTDVGAAGPAACGAVKV